MSRARPVVVWFRDDLRLRDHAALRAAAARGPVLPVFVLDESDAAPRPYGAAARWWLSRSLSSLGDALRDCGGRLVLRRGETLAELGRIARESDAQAIFCSRHYEAAADRLERGLHEALGRDLEIQRFAGRLLVEPEQLKTRAGAPYRVFTPFWTSLASALGEMRARDAPEQIEWFAADVASDTLAHWRLEPRHPDWATGLRATWTPGEPAALAQLDAFIDGALEAYVRDRDRPDRATTSRLSPHLRFGEVSPRQVWSQVQGAAAAGRVAERAAWAFLRELAWREFSWHLLAHFPTLPAANFRGRFDAFPWRRDGPGLEAWQRGATGYPLVDAGMRELWATGWMHNRVRMIVASFLTKHLLLDWRDGEAWFWDTLVDADPANNAASWQWVAGSGVDAAPYFRIFNPVAQGRKFDPAGAYVRRWVPEIAGLPDACLHAPWEAAPAVLDAAGIELGTTYPRPIVDHAAARERALAAYDSIKGS